MSKEHAHCCVCKEKYNRNELYMCCNEHTFCSHCYKTEYYKTNERKCPKKHCYSWVSTSPPVVCKCERNRPKKMFPRPQSVSEKKKVSSQNSIISIYRGKSTSMQLLSRKPVNCPHSGCNKSVAVSSFDAHFTYEHPKVQVIHTYLESRNAMELYLSRIGYNHKICIVRLNVLESGDTGQLLHYETSQGETIKPSLILLATRLPPTFDDQQPQSGYVSDDTVSEDSERPTVFNTDDKLFIWLASSINVELSCTVAISTSCNRVMMKYFGPLVTLDVEPKSLFMAGRGLTVSEHQLLGMTNNLQNHLILNVLVHGKD